MASLVIYGAAGYTGGLASTAARELGLNLILAGRAPATTEQRAKALGVPYRVFDLKDPVEIDEALVGVGALLNCAGPFYRTAEPLIDACIRNRIHYLDIAAELDSYTISRARDEAARKAGITLLPGCGGSVAMLGCLASFCLSEFDGIPATVKVALSVSGAFSRGSAKSAAENTTAKTLHRVNGTLLEKDSGDMQKFDFGDGKGEVDCFPITTPDLITIGDFFNVPNVQTFVHVSTGGLPTSSTDLLRDGPSEEEREASPYSAAVEVTGSDGTIKRSVLHTVNGYTFTAMASVEAAKRVLEDEALPRGFQTPAEIFGSQSVMAVEGTKMRVL